MNGKFKKELEEWLIREGIDPSTCRYDPTTNCRPGSGQICHICGKDTEENEKPKVEES